MDFLSEEMAHCLLSKGNESIKVYKTQLKLALLHNTGFKPHLIWRSRVGDVVASTVESRVLF